MKRFLYLIALAAVAVACSEAEYSGKRAEALDDSAWEVSEWISAADAPVVEGAVHSKKNCRAADGASWFLADFKNDKQVEKALWMTAGLGVYDIYVNGKLIGEEVLKPGFTHYAYTKLSYTYDVTDAFKWLQDRT